MCSEPSWHNTCKQVFTFLLVSAGFCSVRGFCWFQHLQECKRWFHLLQEAEKCLDTTLAAWESLNVNTDTYDPVKQQNPAQKWIDRIDSTPAYDAGPGQNRVDSTYSGIRAGNFIYDVSRPAS